MFSLLSGVYHWLFSRPEVCILLVGLQGSGKTTFFEQLKGRYARSGSKGAAGIAVRAQLGNRVQGRRQDDPANQQHHEKQQQEQQQRATRHQNRQLQTVQQNDTRSIYKQPEDIQSKQDQGDDHPHERHQQVAKGLGIVESQRTHEPNTCALPQVSSTTGLNFCRFRYENVDVILWDLAGLASFHAIWVDYFQNAHCVLYFVDSTSSVEGMRQSRTALNSLTSAAVAVLRKRASDKKHNVCPPPLLIVAAKQDLAGERVPPAGAVRAVFFCEEGNCKSSKEWQRTQQGIYGDESTANGCTHHRCQSNAVFPHSACNWDSVEELLRRAVNAAKAHYELLSLPVDEVTPASTNDAAVPPQWAPYKPVPQRFSADETAMQKHTLLGSSPPRPGESDRKCVLPSDFAHIVSPCTQARNFTAYAGETLSVLDPADPQGESEVSTSAAKMPCWYDGTTSDASGASFDATHPACAHAINASDGDTSQQQSGSRNDGIPPAAGVHDPSTAAYDNADNIIPFRVAAPQEAYQASGGCSAASARGKKLNREPSGLYELDDCM